MRIQLRLFVLVISCAAMPADATTENKAFSIVRTLQAPVIDGDLTDSVWQDAAVIDDFHQIDPEDGAPATEATIVRMLYDDDYLYIGVDLRDSQPDAIRASQLIQGKQFFSDDRFHFMLDSFNNQRNDYFFQVNPNGIRRDALRENNSRFIEEWSTIWIVETQRHEHGWSFEAAIPFKSISFDPTSDTWGVNFGRVIPRNQEVQLWSSHERQDWPAYSGKVSGISDIRQGLGLDIVPSLVATSRNNFAGSGSDEIEPSLDISYRLTPSLNAALTLNTDFSTTEVDDQQVALDRFSIFFPEKRGFFLQDAGIFEFGNIDANGRPFFSRRIGLSGDGEIIDLSAGGKLTGRIGNYNVGMLAIRQEANGDIDASDLLVARASANVLDQSSLGFIATHGDPASNDSNTVIGADFLYQDPDGLFGNILRGHAWLQQSSSEGLSGDDHAFGALLETPTDKVHARLSFLEIGENFNPALGFVNRAGIREYSGVFRWRWRPEDSRWRAINHRTEATLVTDMSGRTLSRTISIRPVTLFAHSTDWYMVEFKRRTENVTNDFSLFGRLNVPAGNYNFNRYRAEFVSGAQRPVNVVLSVQDGDFFGGTRLEKFAELQWRQSEHFGMGLKLEEQDVDLPSGGFRLHLASLRTNVAFNSRWSWSNLLQYENSGDTLGLNSRVRYVPQAGREMLLVLNHGFDVDASNRLDSTVSELNLKLSWTFRY
jgi:Carbohydrate family 9 binding domain-like/Domain of unknown function (DUF5916)